MKYIDRILLLLTIIITIIYTNCAPADIHFDGNGNTHGSASVYITKPSFIGNFNSPGNFTYSFFFKKMDTTETTYEYQENIPQITITSSYKTPTININGTNIYYPELDNYNGYNIPYDLNEKISDDDYKFASGESINYKIKLSLNNADSITSNGTTSDKLPFTIIPIVNSQDSTSVLPLVIYTNTNNIDVPNNNEPSVVAYLR